jgi:hypothetical protein
MLPEPNRGIAMIRTSFFSGRAAMRAACMLPIAAAMLLAGCVTSGYSYREDGGGGYYYGRPSVEYREISPYPYGAYGYGAYGPYEYYGPYGPYRYAYPSPYGYSYYGYGYPYRYVPRYYNVPRTPTADPTPDRPRSPWRDLDSLRRRERTQLPPMTSPTPRPPSVTPVTPSDGSSLGEQVRRARARAKDTP